MRRIPIEAFHAELKAQGMADRADLAFVCPACGTVQSARDLIAAGAGLDFDDVERILTFSCVGRFAGNKQPIRKGGGPCDWTLGGLLKIHTLEVVDADGKAHPSFETASPQQAQRHATEFAAKVGAATITAASDVAGDRIEIEVPGWNDGEIP